MSRFYVGSEVGQLRRVLLHRPELSLRRLTPSNCQELLFDDVLHAERAEAEHDIFRQVLEGQGVEVSLLKDIFTETLAVPEAKSWILDRHCSEHHYGKTLAREVRCFFEEMNNEDLAAYLSGGLTVDEFDSTSSNPTLCMMGKTDFIHPPIPNHLFTRDTSCWIYGGVSINPMAKSARKRETIHFRAIYKFHPMFRQAHFNTYYGDTDDNYDNATIEGGDVLVLGRGTVLIGMSERTTSQGVENLSRALFKTGQANKVIALQLPKARSCMHLDTVLTQMDRDCFSYFPPIMQDNNCWELTPKEGDDEEIIFTKINDGFINAIARALALDTLRMIPTGGDVFEAEREQWNDANNVLAIKPGTVVAYERNIYTIENMQKAGINVLTIPGDELGRGRGGARCMSCPLERDDI